jgi:hypothetical protein
MTATSESAEPRVVRMTATGDSAPVLIVQLDDGSLWCCWLTVREWVRLPNLPLHGEVIPPEQTRRRRASRKR